MQTINITNTNAAEFGTRLGEFAADLASVDPCGIEMSFKLALAAWRDCERVTFAPGTIATVSRAFCAAMKASS